MDIGQFNQHYRDIMYAHLLVSFQLCQLFLFFVYLMKDLSLVLIMHCTGGCNGNVYTARVRRSLVPCLMSDTSHSHARDPALAVRGPAQAFPVTSGPGHRVP